MTNAYTDYGRAPPVTPQSQPIPGHDMVPNNAGGYGFKLDDWERLNRFLITGSEGGTYYVGQRMLTEENAHCVIRCIKEDGWRTVMMALDVNVHNRAPKVDQQLFVLALALRHGDARAKQTAELATHDMLRTGTHLLHFVAMLDGMGGWNRAKRRIISTWFEGQDFEHLTYQVLKYQQRDGWTMKDVLRLAHPRAETPQHSGIYDWICGRPNEHEPILLTVHRSIHTPHAEITSAQQAIEGIRFGLPREALPTEALSDKIVLRALIPTLPLHALLRNLGNYTSSGVMDDARLVSCVVAKLTDRDALRKARVHPFAILLATMVYKTGQGVRGKKTWVPVPAILAALEDAYDAAFDHVTPTNKRILIGIDISHSMDASCVGTPVPASMAAAAMAITLARMEPHAVVVQFDTMVKNIMPVTKRTGIAGLSRTDGGGTDVAAPVLWASGFAPKKSLYGAYFGQGGLNPRRAEFDAFVILTDNETWAGGMHTTQALKLYRQTVNPAAKLVCCSMASNEANVVDPNDTLSFGCAGLDANLPSLVAAFIDGKKDAAVA